MERKGNLKEARCIFGARVRLLRKTRQLTQEQLGSMTGIDRTRISRLESGRTCVKFDTILLLANALGVSASDLLAGVDLPSMSIQERLSIALSLSRRM